MEEREHQEKSLLPGTVGARCFRGRSAVTRCDARERKRKLLSE